MTSLNIWLSGRSAPLSGPSEKRVIMEVSTVGRWSTCHRDDGGAGVRDAGGEDSDRREIMGVDLNINVINGKGGLVNTVRWRLTLVSRSLTGVDQINSTSS